MSDFIEVNITKPLYEYQGSPFVNIRDIYLNKAKKTKKMLKIITPTTVHYTTPEQWIKTGKKTSEVFLFPDRPMKLVGNYAINNNPPPKSTPMVMDISVRERLKEIWKQKYAKTVDDR